MSLMKLGLGTRGASRHHTDPSPPLTQRKEEGKQISYCQHHHHHGTFPQLSSTVAATPGQVERAIDRSIYTIYSMHPYTYFCVSAILSTSYMALIMCQKLFEIRLKLP